MRKLVWLCLVAACGSSSPNHPDGGGSGDGGKSADAPAVTRRGLVSVSQGDENGGPSSQASAAFLMGPDAVGPVLGSDGPCTAYGESMTATLDAGSISITGTVSPVTLTASGSPLRYHAGSTVPYPIYSAGATIAFAGAGGADIPAFSGSVTGPAEVAGFTKPTSLSRAGYTATWTAGSGPAFWVLVLGVDSTSATIVICRVSDTGSFTVPASAFALLPSSDTMAAAGVARVAQTDVDVSGARVSLYALAEITSSIVPLGQ